MAATWIKPVHVSSGKTEAETIKYTLDYVSAPAKTQDGYLVDAYKCTPFTADLEFMDAKQDYFMNTGRKPEGDVLVYHVRQSFKEGEITVEVAKELGYKLAMELTGGKHAFVVATHNNTKCYHNHLIICAVNLERTGKYRNKLKSYKELSKISDRICAEHGYSVIENRDFGTGSHKPKEERLPSHREILVQHIDEALATKPKDFDNFLKILSDAGCKIKKRGTTISVLPPNGAKRYFRFRTGQNGLPDERQPEPESPATPESFSVMPVFELETTTMIESNIVPIDTATTEKIQTTNNQHQPSQLNIILGEKIKNLIDIEKSAKTQSSRGYEIWAKSFNLQQTAQALLLIQDNNIADLDELTTIVQQAQNEFNAFNNQINTADTRLKEISTLQRNIGTYRKTNDIYSQYLRSKRNKNFYSKNEKAILSCEATKEYFNSLGLEKIPTIKELQAEYTSLVGEKQKCIIERDQLRKQLMDLQSAQKNIHALLGLPTNESTTRQNTHESR